MFLLLLKFFERKYVFSTLNSDDLYKSSEKSHLDFDYESPFLSLYYAAAVSPVRQRPLLRSFSFDVAKEVVQKIQLAMTKTATATAAATTPTTTAVPTTAATTTAAMTAEVTRTNFVQRPAAGITIGTLYNNLIEKGYLFILKS